MAPEKNTIARVAHDGKKADIVMFANVNKEKLLDFNLVGTGHTASMIANKTGLPVKPMLSGPLGGDAQIAAMVASGQCHGVIFLRGPLGMHPHDPDIAMLMRVCDVHNVPLATNLATAELIVSQSSLFETSKFLGKVAARLRRGKARGSRQSA